jgi:hypothetical protein
VSSGTEDDSSGDEGRIAVRDEGDSAAERQAALVGLLSAGLEPPPAVDQLVSALAEARRAVTSYQVRNESPEGWLMSEMGRRGIRENAAVLATLELPEYRELAADAYRRVHPDRVGQLEAFLRHLQV